MNGGGRCIGMARVAAAALLGALLAVRLLWDSVTYPESDAFIALAALALLAALLAATALGGGGWRLRASADAWVLGYCLVILVLSLSSRQRWRAQGVLCQTVACTAAFLIAANAAASRRARRALVAALVAATLLVSLYGLYQYFQGLEETWAALGGAAGLMRGDNNSAFLSRLLSHAVFSTFFYPNAFAGFLVVAIPCTASVLLARRRDAIPAASAGYLGLLAAAVVAWPFFPDLAGNPLILAAVFVGATALAVCLGIAERRPGRLLRTLCILPIAVVPVWALALTASEGAWLALLAAAVYAPLLFTGRVKTAAGIALAAAAAAILLARAVPGGMADSLGARADYWRAAFRMWRAHPFVGLGPGAFAGAYPAFRLPGSEEGRMAHSAYLGLAAETGLAGLAVFLCMAAAWLSALRTPAGRRETLCAAVFVSLCAFLLHGAADVCLVVPGTTFTVWLIAGLGAGAASPPGGRKRLSPPAGIALAALVLAGAAWLVVPHARAEASRLAALRHAGAGRAGEARAAIEKAIGIEGSNPEYWTLLAAAQGQEGGDAVAVTAYGRAAALGDGIPSYRFRYAICLWRLSGNGRDRGRAAAAIGELRGAVRDNPHDPDYRLLMGDWLEKTGQGEESLLEYRRALALIGTSRRTPHRIRRHSPAMLEKLEAMVRAKVEEMERDAAP